MSKWIRINLNLLLVCSLNMNAVHVMSYKMLGIQTKLLSTATRKTSSSLCLSGVISWYPGHIAKAERELADYIKKVDVVIEVRDARIPFSTTHPKVPEWVGSRPLVVALVRIDQISNKALQDWREYYALNPACSQKPDTKIYFVDGKLGAGVFTLKKHAMKAGVSVNEKRLRRGMQPRAVRAAVIGFPNVGKSAIINRLLGRRMAKSMNMPGVTRSLRWVRLGADNELSEEDTIELLDSPGIIPAKDLDQEQALQLAMCNDIGEASYDRVVVAGLLCDKMNHVHRHQPEYINMNRIIERYGLPFNEMTAADRILGDFRRGLLGKMSLEIPPTASPPRGQPVKKNRRIEEHMSGSSPGYESRNNRYDGNEGFPPSSSSSPMSDYQSGDQGSQRFRRDVVVGRRREGDIVAKRDTVRHDMPSPIARSEMNRGADSGVGSAGEQTVRASNRRPSRIKSKIPAVAGERSDGDNTEDDNDKDEEYLSEEYSDGPPVGPTTEELLREDKNTVSRGVVGMGAKKKLTRSLDIGRGNYYGW